MVRIFLAFLMVFVISSCIPTSKKAITEGVIEYDVHYLDEEKESLYSFLLPKKMYVKFAKNKIKSELEGFSNNFYFSFIANTKSDSSIALFKIMNHHYYYVEDTIGQSDLFGDLPGMVIDYTKDTCTIAGLKCKKALIKSQNNNFEPFSVAYTKKIKIHNPNNKNPFRQIDDVLLDFTLNLYNMDMRFVANKVTNMKIPNSEFKIPEGYQRINKQNLEQLISIME